MAVVLQFCAASLHGGYHPLVELPPAYNFRTSWPALSRNTLSLHPWRI
uniref:Uncharacterized protein n=1 Tax=Arundo donax TaxID=35708 RepID=A0A0A8Z1D1_ARUDO